MEHCFLGVDVGGTGIKAALVTESGEITNRAELPTEAHKGPAGIKANIAQCARSCLAEATIGARAIGVGCAGIVDDRGNVFNPPQFPDWEKESLGTWLSMEMELPVWVDNDANVATLAEAEFGAGKPFNDFALMTLGTGVGGGLILKRELYKGAGFAAGEIGHMTVFPDGKPCKCGSRGCLEHYVGIQAIVERARGYLDSAPPDSALKQMAQSGEITPKTIHAAAEAGDPVAARVFAETGMILGYAAASIFTLLNIQAMLLAGGVSQAGEYLMGPMRQTVEKYAHRSPLLKLKIRQATMGKDAGVVGAAALAMRESQKTFGK